MPTTDRSAVPHPASLHRLTGGLPTQSLLFGFGGAVLGHLLSTTGGDLNDPLLASLIGGVLGFVLGAIRALYLRVEHLEGTLAARDFRATAPPDTATPDTATPDTATPDTATPDTATPDTATPDTAAPDTATPATARANPDPGPPPDRPTPRNKAPAAPPTAAVPGPRPVPPFASSTSPWTSTRPAPSSSETRAPETRATRIRRQVVGFVTGGNVLAKVGAALLFVGLAFFARYASQQFDVPIALRLAAIGLGGLGLFGLGWRLRRRPDAYGLVLQGAGVATLYLTMFTAARWYDLVPLGAALVSMTSLVVATCVLALRQNSQALAVLALSGGFLAPVLMDFGPGHHLVTYSFYAVLNVGVFALAWFRSWRLVNWVGFAFTFGLAPAVGIGAYAPEHFATTQPFLAFFFLLYVVVSLLFTRRDARGWRGMIDGSLIFGTPIVGFGLQAALVKDMPFGLAYSSLAVAMVYLGLTAWLHRQGALKTLLGQSFLALGIVFISLTLPFAFDNQAWTAAAWALEGAGLVWVGLRQRRQLPRIFGYLLQAAAPWIFLNSNLGMAHGSAPIPIVNSTFMGFVTLAIAAFFSAYRLWRDDQHASRLERVLRWTFLAGAVVAWSVGGLREIGEHGPSSWVWASCVLFITLTSAALTCLALRWRWFDVRIATWLLLPSIVLATLVKFVQSGPSISPWTEHGWLAWPLALAVLLWQAWTGDRDPRWPRPVVAFTHVGITLLLAFLGAWTAATVVDVGASTWRLVLWGWVPAILAATLLRHGNRLRWPVRCHPESYLGMGLMPLIGMLLGWVFISSYTPGDPAPLPYLPLINPLELVQMFILLIAVGWTRRQTGTRFTRWHGVTTMAVAATAFFWLSMAAARAVHWMFDVPFRVDAMLASPIYQTTLAIAWTVVALVAMTVGSRRSSRLTWLAGACLLGVVIVKLFLVDLSASGTLARVVSFLSVGGLTLAMGYLAPLPPRPSLPSPAPGDAPRDVVLDGDTA